MKLKDTVKQSAKIGRDKNLKLVINEPLSYHPMMVQLIIDRVNELKRSKGIVQLDKECDVVLIGHGSRTRMPMTHLLLQTRLCHTIAMWNFAF